MTPWFRRALIRGLVGPIAYGVVSILVCLFYIWAIGSVFGGNNLASSGGRKVYKNYIEKLFVYEITSASATEIASKIELENVLLDDQKTEEGTFVIVPIKDAIFTNNA